MLTRKDELNQDVVVMERFDKIVNESLDGYFEALKKSGYLPDTTVFQLLLLMFINKILRDYHGFINEADYQVIIKKLTCLQDSSCVVPYGIYVGISDVQEESKVLRITEDNILRKVEELENLRITNKD